MIKFNGINHLSLATKDMDLTLLFWRDLLGMPLVAGLGRPGYRQYFLAIDERNMLTFFEWPGVESIPEKDHGVPVRGPFAFDHVSFGVEERAMLWQVKDKLEAADYWCSEAIDHGFIISIYSFDPNGIAIEFSWARPSVDLRANPRLADRDPGKLAREGSQPQPGHWPPVTKATAPEDQVVYPGEGSELAAQDPPFGNGKTKRL